MPKMFHAEVQIITEDNMTAEKLQQQLEAKLSSFKSVDAFVREVNYAGNIERGLDELEDFEDEQYEQDL